MSIVPFRPGAALAALLLGAHAVPATPQVASIGLSSVRAQRITNQNLAGFEPQAGDHFGMALAVGDFNGDGLDDLATGLPDDDGISGLEVVDAGAVIVSIAFPGAGLVPVNFLRQTPGLDPAEVGDDYGWALVACDINGDDFDDLAVGIPFENYGEDDAGAIQLHFGGPGGLAGTGDRFLAQSSPGIPGDNEEEDLFGWSLACGDFDHDGFDDLVVGVPGEDLAAGSLFFNDGMVVVIPGSAAGLDQEAALALDQDVAGMNGECEDYDFFGGAIAAADFNHDGFDDLAIGVAGEDDGDGAVQVVFGSAAGLTTAGNLLRTEEGIGGSSEEEDQFGSALAAADFDGDGFDDLAIGIRFEDLGPINEIDDAGRAAVLYGAAAGFDFGRTQFWSQDSILGAGTSELNDRTGFALAAGDFDGDGFADLALGAPREFVWGPDDGAAVVMMGTASGLTAARHRGIAGGGGGFPGHAEEHDRFFARALASGDFDGDGHADLAIGAPYENPFAISDAGGQLVLYGALFADGFETGAGELLWSDLVP